MDGYITIGTELDTKSFEEQIRQTEERLNRLVSSYEKASNRKDGFKPNEKAMANLREEIEKTSNALITLRQKQDNLAKSSLINMPKMVDNVGKSVENVTKKVLKWGLAIFGIRSAYNAVRSAVSTLSQYNDQIKTDIEFIRYAVASSLQPVIERLIQLVYKLLGYLNYIAKAWFGIDLFANASADAMNKTNKSAQKLKKTLTGFDEMNVLNDNGTTGIGNAPTTPSGSFEIPEGEVPEWLEWIVENKDIIIATLTGIGAALSLWQIEKLLVANETISKVNIDEIIGIGVAVAGLMYAIQGLLQYLEEPTWENFGQIIQGIGIAVAGLGVAFLGLPAIITGVVVTIVGTIVRYWEEIKTLLVSAGNWLEGSIDSVYSVFGDTIGRIYENFVYMFKGIVIGLDEIFTGVKSMLDGIINLIVGVFTGNWSRAWNGVLQIFSGIFNSIVGIARIVITTVAGIASSIATAVGDTIAGIFKAIINGVLGVIESLLNKPIKSVNDLIGLVNTLPGVNLKPIKTFKFPRLAVGGIVNMPGRGVPIGGAITGEAGKEGVLPLTDSQAMSELGATIGKYITINANITNTMNGRVISREIKKINANSDFARNS